MNNSLWKEYKNEKKYESLNKNITTDVLVIGGGIAGICVLRKLKENNINAILVEKDEIASHTTCATTAFISCIHETLYQDMFKNQRNEYYRLNKIALEEYKSLSKQLDFDFEKVDSCIFSKNNKIKKEYEILKEIGADVYLDDDIPFNEGNIGVVLKDQAMINPVKLVNELSKELNIYEHSEVVYLGNNHAILKNGYIIKFKCVVICTHYPITNKLNLMFMKLTQRKSYVVCVKKETIKNTYCSVDNDGMYYRMYKDIMIIGGNDVDTGKKCLCSFKKQVLEKHNLKEEDIVYSWVGEDTITLDGIPYIGKSDIFHPNHIIVTGFNFWGFTWAMAGSSIVVEYIKNNAICNLTKPNRFFIVDNLFKNIFNSIINILKPTTPRCTHLGSALVYNKNENVWECPSHGSIYNKEGAVIEGPAIKNL